MLVPPVEYVKVSSAFQGAPEICACDCCAWNQQQVPYEAARGHCISSVVVLWTEEPEV